MVHGIPADDVRHAGWPLRLGSDGTDAVVERHGIRCSHFDAYRFFTESARPRNALRPTRDSQVAMEQPGCLHAGMDVYKWAFKLTPLVPSDLVADAFDLAREIRVLDMEASPYDLRELGYAPVPIETPEGKATYLERQRALRASGPTPCDAACSPCSTTTMPVVSCGNGCWSDRLPRAHGADDRRPGQRGATPARTRP